MTNQSSILYWVGHKFHLGFSLLIGQSNSTRKMLVMKKKCCQLLFKIQYSKMPQYCQKCFQRPQNKFPLFVLSKYHRQNSQSFSGHHDGCGVCPCGDCEPLGLERVFQFFVTSLASGCLPHCRCQENRNWNHRILCSNPFLIFSDSTTLANS